MGAKVFFPNGTPVLGYMAFNPLHRGMRAIAGMDHIHSTMLQELSILIIRGMGL
jgi:hypothetical protein